MKKKLDVYEKEIENGETYKPVSSSKRKKIESLIDNQKKTKNINIRINESDLLLVKERSVQYGIPYQTLIASIIHRYVTDQLVDERAVSIAAKRS